METAAKVLEEITERRERMQAYEANDNKRSDQFEEKRCFVELLYQNLIEIPESEEKAMTMLQKQQMLIRLC